MPVAGPDKKGAEPLPMGAGPALLALVGGGAVFYFWLVFTRWKHAAEWGNFGDAVGPFVALLNAGAVFFALYSVRLQRQELALQRAELKLQREELAANREVMREQADQAKATAEAQKRLADSQDRLATAQESANAIAVGLQLARVHGEGGTVDVMQDHLRARLERIQGLQPSERDIDEVRAIEKELEVMSSRLENQQNQFLAICELLKAGVLVKE